MKSHPLPLPEPVTITGSSVMPSITCPVLAAVKARAKALKRLRKQEARQFFMSWCAGLHALGFSF